VALWHHRTGDSNGCETEVTSVRTRIAHAGQSEPTGPTDLDALFGALPPE
jgi:hypothetical protein